MDCGSRDPDRLGTNLASRLGSRTRARAVHDRILRLRDGRERDLGKLAALLGLPAAHFIAAAGALVAIPLTWHWKLQAGAGVDLTASMHWPTPLTAQPIDRDRGPVLV